MRQGGYLFFSLFCGRGYYKDNYLENHFVSPLACYKKCMSFMLCKTFLFLEKKNLAKCHICSLQFGEHILGMQSIK
jgi:hypothetical protein